MQFKKRKIKSGTLLTRVSFASPVLHVFCAIYPVIKATGICTAKDFFFFAMNLLDSVEIYGQWKTAFYSKKKKKGIMRFLS